MRILLTFFTVMILSLNGLSQNTVGLLSYEPWKSYDGYNLVFPHNQAQVYLLDNCGRIVHQWEDEAQFRPGNIAYITQEGNLLKAKRTGDISQDAIWAGGGGHFVEMLDWDNNLLWSYGLNNESERLHHDIEMLPNGNVLMIAWEALTTEEAIAIGRDTALISQDALWPDQILEYDPSLDSIVWRWRAIDHLVQDFDDTKPNFGMVEDNPNKINLNYDTNDGKADWMHCNSIDFDPLNNHILLSVPTFSEFWIIDHSTSTEEAAGSTGGFGGKGGDLLYRWGNPAAYNQGTEDDRKSFYQHDVHYIGEFLDPWHPLVGKIGFFNNRVGDDFSTANILSQDYDMYMNVFGMQDGRFLPEETDVTITHPVPQEMYSTGLSSFQVLNNDNYLLSSGRFGYSFEMTSDSQEIVWEYKTPTNGPATASQGDTLAINNNLTFRLKRYPLDFAGFADKDLTPGAYWELNPDEDFCLQALPNKNLDSYKLKVYPNPAFDELILEWEAVGMMKFELYDLYGRRIQSIEATGGKKHMNIENLNPGIYFLNAAGKESIKIIKTK